jgi:hypothetical protein
VQESILDTHTHSTRHRNQPMVYGAMNWIAEDALQLDKYDKVSSRYNASLHPPRPVGCFEICSFRSRFNSDGSLETSLASTYFEDKVEIA